MSPKREQPQQATQASSSGDAGLGDMMTAVNLSASQKSSAPVPQYQNPPLDTLDVEVDCYAAGELKDKHADTAPVKVVFFLTYENGEFKSQYRRRDNLHAAVDLKGGHPTGMLAQRDDWRLRKVWCKQILEQEKRISKPELKIIAQAWLDRKEHPQKRQHGEETPAIHLRREEPPEHRTDEETPDTQLFRELSKNATVQERQGASAGPSKGTSQPPQVNQAVASDVTAHTSTPAITEQPSKPEQSPDPTGNISDTDLLSSPPDLPSSPPPKSPPRSSRTPPLGKLNLHQDCVPAGIHKPNSRSNVQIFFLLALEKRHGKDEFDSWYLDARGEYFPFDGVQLQEEGVFEGQYEKWNRLENDWRCRDAWAQKMMTSDIANSALQAVAEAWVSHGKPDRKGRAREPSALGNSASSEAAGPSVQPQAAPSGQAGRTNQPSQPHRTAQVRPSNQPNQPGDDDPSSSDTESDGNDPDNPRSDSLDPDKDCIVAGKLTRPERGTTDTTVVFFLKSWRSGGDVRFESQYRLRERIAKIVNPFADHRDVFEGKFSNKNVQENDARCRREWCLLMRYKDESNKQLKIIAEAWFRAGQPEVSWSSGVARLKKVPQVDESKSTQRAAAPSEAPGGDRQTAKPGRSVYRHQSPTQKGRVEEKSEQRERIENTQKKLPNQAVHPHADGNEDEDDSEGDANHENDHQASPESNAAIDQDDYIPAGSYLRSGAEFQQVLFSLIAHNDGSFESDYRLQEDMSRIDPFQTHKEGFKSMYDKETPLKNDLKCRREWYMKMRKEKSSNGETARAWHRADELDMNGMTRKERREKENREAAEGFQREKFQQVPDNQQGSLTAPTQNENYSNASKPKKTIPEREMHDQDAVAGPSGSQPSMGEAGQHCIPWNNNSDRPLEELFPLLNRQLIPAIEAASLSRVRTTLDELGLAPTEEAYNEARKQALELSQAFGGVRTLRQTPAWKLMCLTRLIPSLAKEHEEMSQDERDMREWMEWMTQAGKSRVTTEPIEGKAQPKPNKRTREIPEEPSASGEGRNPKRIRGNGRRVEEWRRGSEDNSDPDFSLPDEQEGPPASDPMGQSVPPPKSTAGLSKKNTSISGRQYARRKGAEKKGKESQKDTQKTPTNIPRKPQPTATTRPTGPADSTTAENPARRGSRIEEENKKNKQQEQDRHKAKVFAEVMKAKGEKDGASWKSYTREEHAKFTATFTTSPRGRGRRAQAREAAKEAERAKEAQKAARKGKTRRGLDGESGREDEDALEGESSSELDRERGRGTKRKRPVDEADEEEHQGSHTDDDEAELEEEQDDDDDDEPTTTIAPGKGKAKAKASAKSTEHEEARPAKKNKK